MPLCPYPKGVQSVLTSSCTTACLKSRRPDARTTRRHLHGMDSCHMMTMQVHILLQQQRTSLPSAEWRWSFIHPVLQTSLPVTGSYSHMSENSGPSSTLFSRPLPPATGSYSHMSESSCKKPGLRVPKLLSDNSQGPSTPLMKPHTDQRLVDLPLQTVVRYK